MACGNRTFIGAVALGLLLSACGGLRDGSQTPAEPVEILQADRYTVMMDGGSEPLTSLAPIPVTHDLSAFVTVTPQEGRWRRLMAIRLSRPAQDNEPVSDATIAASVSMQDMPRMVYKEDVAAVGDGGYEIPVRFSMPGAWQLHLIILAGEDAGQVTLNIELAAAG